MTPKINYRSPPITPGAQPRIEQPCRDFTLTVAICTHNRPDDVAECLEALYAQDLSGIHLLVVDSASQEDAHRSITRVVANKANLRLIRLELPGLSVARNAAREAALAPWLAYLDDDVIPAPDWVAQARRLIAVAPTNCPVIGGRVDPLYPSGVVPQTGPRWNQLLSLVQDQGEGERAGCAKVSGANVIFRRDALLMIGSFPAQLGRVGDVLLSGEEKLVIERLCEVGWHVFYSDRLCVHHKISHARLTRQWATKRAYWDGVSDQKIRRFMRRPIGILDVAKIAGAIPVLGMLAPVPSPPHEFFIRLWYNMGLFGSFFFL
jgi:glycosyltransferase involved in cell wall biosynthesis